MKMNREFHTVRGYQMLNSESKVLTSSMEDYLEMIYRICLENGYARINQLADKLNVRPSSTTKVVQKLYELGLVDYQRYGIIQLMENGKSIGEFLLERHEIIEEFLGNIGVKETLLKDTELIEHDVSLSALEAITSLNKFLTVNPQIKKQYDAFRLNPPDL
ncbi:MAG TPA: DtxR family transcriptional regulator [Clostridiales bacterium]|nr:iron dependent repressor, metal binding and dimerization domain protein [Clostridia bacterium]MDD4679722.1 iron dependent repressor, metal binding and dimerization domain protein [Clostridia bacterium]HCS74739.1 DtxR family transcriptional regulator [Clostridiales bacterium]